jgi:hypothetical protein
MKYFFKILILFSIVFFIGSCNDPIFYMVFQETPILKPFINGSPTNFVIFGNPDKAVYVASGKKIFVYNGKWSEWINLSDRIGALAATDSSLYALYLENDTNAKIKNITSGEILSFQNVQSIHADGDVLFVSAIIYNNNTYSYKIYYRKDGDTNFSEIPFEEPNSWIAGAASDAHYYYLCVGSCIYCLDKSSIAPVDLVFKEDSGDVFTGIVKINDDYCAAVSGNGKIYQINNGTISSVTDKFTDGRSSTGAIAVWYKENTATNPSLLLVGRKENYYTTSSGYTNGYVEITLDPLTGKIKKAQFTEPGKNTAPDPSSVIGDDGYERYVSLLGKQPVNHIIQTPSYIDPNMRLFASTQQNGVWSYRDRGEGMRWNAEQP